MVILRGAAVKTRFSIIALATAAVACRLPTRILQFYGVAFVGDDPLRINEVVMNTHHKLSLIICNIPTDNPSLSAFTCGTTKVAFETILISPDRHTKRSFGTQDMNQEAVFRFGLRPN